MNAHVKQSTLEKQSSEAEIKAKIGDISAVEVFHNQVLVAIFIRPERTAGGIILADQTRQEDVWQGKVGLVLKAGPIAFKSDDRNDFSGMDIKAGDWIGFRSSDGFALTINDTACRLLEDVNVKIRISNPLSVW